jgi:hypothetical protein
MLVVTAAALVPISSAGANAASRSAATTFWVVGPGDSYTAGNGAQNIPQPDRGCHRSLDSYAWRYSARLSRIGPDVPCRAAGRFSKT